MKEGYKESKTQRYTDKENIKEEKWMQVAVDGFKISFCVRVHPVVL